MKRDKKQPAAKEKVFTSTPFSALKGLPVAEPPPVKTPAPQKVVEPPRPDPRVARADDLDLFQRAMADVRRFAEPEPGERPPRRPGPPPPKPGELLDEEERRLFLETVGRLKMDVTFADHLPESAGKPQASPGRMRQLKRGSIRIDFELDLHGLTRDEALPELSRFISGAHRRGQQAVLVITGKGNNSEGGPVLQGAVAGWLRDTGKAMVAEFSPAPRELGGDGALVVFLRAPKG
jgi:DNA-nicking Smr family endonuclease